MNTDVKFFATTVEDECRQQVETLASCPAFEGAKIRIMPDCHSGKGCVIGFTANLGDKVVPNVIGVDLGCFTADTKVKLTDGRDITFEDLVTEYEQGRDNYCYCIDSSNHIIVEKIKYPRKIKVVDRLVEVTLDNGETVRCTEDHLFYLRYGETVRADELVPGSKLMSLDIKFGKDLYHEVISVRHVYVPNTPVYCLTNPEYENFGLSAGVFVHNCGMYVCKLSTPVRDFEWFDKVVRQVVPMGFSLQDRKMCRLSDYNFTCFKKLNNKDRLEMSLGTLGSGNHFVELDEDSEGNQYLVVHSGSRNLGLQVCNIYQQRAKNAHEGEVPKDLEYLDGTLKDDYVHDMKLAQQFAVANREEMVKHICGKGQLDFEWSFHTVHNYLGDDNVIRKGAISAKAGEVVYIPLNMRDGGVIAVGKGNSDWNNSAPHGAGRLMSRAKARDTLSVDEFKQQMTEANIWSSSVCEGTIDEAPGAYKPVEEILSVIGDTVDIVNTVKPVYNAKAVDSGRRRNRKGR